MNCKGQPTLRYAKYGYPGWLRRGSHRPQIGDQSMIIFCGDGALHRVGPQNWTRWVNAPSTIRLVPVIKLARGLARKTTAFATSSAVPIRPIGLRDRIVLN